MKNNTLYYGDNLEILRDFIPNESVDLIYLDPPFNSNRNYNVLFREESGQESEAQITAFEDTWHWNKATAWTYDEIITTSPDEIATMINAMKTFVGANQMMAYLVMMTVRLIELHRVLKPTGSLYLHCDPTASHYLKIILDTIFGAQNFRNEIVWIRTSAHANVSQKFGAVHDIIYFYSKSKHFTWNQQYLPYSDEYIKTFFDQKDSNGSRYARRDLTASMERASSGQLYSWKGITPPPSRCWAMTQNNMDELFAKGRIHFPKKEGGMPRLKLYPEDLPGIPIQDVWTDIRPLHNLTSERLGYPTQKPVELLKRILQTSSNEDDVILDAFCGCGTSIAAAQELNRRWMGIDVTHLAIALQKYRLRDAFKLVENRDYIVIGEPKDLHGARQLAEDSRYQFQWWALSLVQAIPIGSSFGSKIGKKGADRGIDGVINFMELGKDKLKRVLIQVKSGKVKSSDIRDLRGTMERENAAISVFITLEKPSPQMITEASEAGFYQAFTGAIKYPKLQIVTIEELLHGSEIKMPPRLHQNFKAAQRIPDKIKQTQPTLYE